MKFLRIFLEKITDNLSEATQQLEMFKNEHGDFGTLKSKLKHFMEQNDKLSKKVKKVKKKEFSLNFPWIFLEFSNSIIYIVGGISIIDG